MMMISVSNMGNGTTTTTTIGRPPNSPFTSAIMMIGTKNTVSSSKRGSRVLVVAAAEGGGGKKKQQQMSSSSSRTGKFGSKNSRKTTTLKKQIDEYEEEEQQLQLLQKTTTTSDEDVNTRVGLEYPDGIALVISELPGLQTDFWEGPQWDTFGFIIQYLWAFGILFALVACGIAVATYNEGATDFKKTPVYQESIQSRDLLEEPEGSNSDVFEFNPTEDAPSLE